MAHDDTAGQIVPQRTSKTGQTTPPFAGIAVDAAESRYRRTAVPRHLGRERVVITTSTSNETLSIPLHDLDQAQLRIAFGGGELTLRQAEPGSLIDGTFDGGVIQRSNGHGKVHLEQLGRQAFVGWRPLRWDVGVTAEIPVDLRLDTGANRSTIDLTSLRIPRLELRTGASDTYVRLPATGQTSVRIACGLASVTVEVPRGVAARIRGTVSFGATQVDEARFPRWGDSWASPDYETALNRVDIAVEGGFGSIRVA